MNKREMIDLISTKSNLSPKDVNKVIDSFTKIVESELKKGNKVMLVGFGTFETKIRKRREGINPQTKKRMTIEETIIPKFKPGKALRDSVNNLT